MAKPEKSTPAKTLSNKRYLRELAKLQLDLASDLASVDVLADGRLAALSERRHALVGEKAEDIPAVLRSC